MENQGTGTQKQGILTGMFSDRESSEGAYKSLRDRGYSDDDISVLMTDETRSKWYGDGDTDSELGSKAAEGATTGGAIGGGLGAILGGIPEDRAKEYEEGLKGGGAVLGVHPRSDEDADYFENDWKTTHRGQGVYR
jgi:hypothetical protein